MPMCSVWVYNKFFFLICIAHICPNEYLTGLHDNAVISVLSL